jgi:hypothetical protein
MCRLTVQLAKTFRQRRETAAGQNAKGKEWQCRSSLAASTKAIPGQAPDVFVAHQMMFHGKSGSESFTAMASMRLLGSWSLGHRKDEQLDN